MSFTSVTVIIMQVKNIPNKLTSAIGKHIICLLIACLTIVHSSYSQILVVSDQANDTAGSASAVLQAKSTTKGFLPPQMTMAQRIAISSPAQGLLVYQNNSTKGLYYYKDTSWTLITSDDIQPLHVVTKTTSDTLDKTETFVLAKNNITLVLPAITSADNGLIVTIKNVGIYTDLVTVLPNGSSKIDSISYIPMPPMYSFTLVAANGSWFIKNRTSESVNTLKVSWASPWKTIGQAIEFLNAHMWDAGVIDIEGGAYDIAETINIDLPYPLTIKGASYGTTTLRAASGLSGGPMFSCASECYFKMLAFDATTLSGYGNSAGEDAIQLTGSGVYHEIKDCSFDHFNKTIRIQNDVELWLFESDIYNAVASAVDIDAGSTKTVTFKTSEVDFISCEKGISLTSGANSTLSVLNCGFYNATSTSVAIHYHPSTFVTTEAGFFSNNTWNGVGTFIDSFDFSRSDGRDAAFSMANNLGDENQNPHCKINVLNNSSTFSVTPTWVKASWSSGSQTQIPKKITVGTNKITYQPTNERDLVMWISGNIIDVGSSNRTFNIGIVKNGNSSVRYGETTVRAVNSGQPFQWSTVVYLSDVQQSDYFEIWLNLGSSGTETVTFQDVNWFTSSQ